MNTRIFWLGLVFFGMLGIAGCKSSQRENGQEGFEATGQLNDTGLLLCAGDVEVELACPQTDLPGQDAEYGRDASAQSGSLQKTGAGIGGFDWTKLSSAGDPLTYQNRVWQADGNELEGTRWSCVVDHVTGLMWEIKESDAQHPRYGGHSYAWWFDDPQKNGGYGQQFDSGSCTTPPCHTQHYVEWVNAQGLCGYADWRMPSVRELSSIVVLSRVIPALDKLYFPNAVQPRFFTSESLARDPSLAWYVYFSDGSVSSTNKGDASHIRLVRGGQ